MNYFYYEGKGSKINLQATLAQSTCDANLQGEVKGTHHPISCSPNSPLYLGNDNTMWCEHSKAPPSNPRNQAIINATIAILLMEEVERKFGI